MSIGEQWLIRIDTIKVRMQLSKRAKAPGVSSHSLNSHFSTTTTYSTQPHQFRFQQEALLSSMS